MALYYNYLFIGFKRLVRKLTSHIYLNEEAFGAINNYVPQWGEYVFTTLAKRVTRANTE